MLVNVKLGIVNPEIKICWKLSLRQDIQNVCEFLSSS